MHITVLSYLHLTTEEGVINSFFFFFFASLVLSYFSHKFSCPFPCFIMFFFHGLSLSFSRGKKSGHKGVIFLTKASGYEQHGYCSKAIQTISWCEQYLFHYL